jgi:hypothetical protein
MQQRVHYAFPIFLGLSVAYALSPPVSQQRQQHQHHVLRMSSNDNAFTGNDDGALNKWSRYVCLSRIICWCPYIFYVNSCSFVRLYGISVS